MSRTAARVGEIRAGDLALDEDVDVVTEAERAAAARA